MIITVEHLPFGFVPGAMVEFSGRLYRIVQIDRRTGTIQLEDPNS